jgi:hypothetical protein
MLDLASESSHFELTVATNNKETKLCDKLPKREKTFVAACDFFFLLAVPCSSLPVAGGKTWAREFR